tara:strand:+ start:199 stop:672 length:474 start_codon:yes stop_codon:yes gene_type:complete
VVKKILLVIFISILVIGCDNQMIAPIENYESIGVIENEEPLYYLQLESYLDIDANGYYTMEFLNNYYQTFTTLSAITGSNEVYQKVSWMSNKEIKIGGYWTNLVNGSSYTDDNGEAHTVLGIWPEFVDDTIKVFAGYTDEDNNHYVDSLEVIVVDNE